MTEERPYWNMEMEQILDTPAMRAVQLEKASRLLERLYESKPYWRARMDAANAKPDSIKSLDDFSQGIPVIDKGQKRELFEKCGGDMVEFVDMTIGTPLDELVMLAATSGTTGEPTPYPFARSDFEFLAESIRRAFWRMGVRKGDRLLHAMGLSMFSMGVPGAKFFSDAGACVIPVGAEAGTEKILSTAKMFRPDTMSCSPSLATHLIEKAPEVIGSTVGELGIQRLFCSGEPGAGIPEVRSQLESAYGARVFDFGGPAAISCDHDEYQGVHMIGEDLYLFELVDPDTYAPIEIEDGATGLYVVTTLDGEGFLLLRETFGDMVQVFTEPCPCGKSGIRMKYVGRTDDMLKVKGVIVYPAAIEGVISSFTPRVTGHFRIVLNEPPPRVVPPLRLKVEYGSGVDEGDLATLEKEIGEAMHNKLKFRPRIDWLPPGSIERSTHKTQLIEKVYEG